jgi:hypothetical protein
MTDNDLTPRVLAGLALGEDPSKFMSFRIMPDQSVVVVDPEGRKFILAKAELKRVYDEVIARRLHARGRALVEDLKNGEPKPPPVPAPAAAGPGTIKKASGKDMPRPAAERKTSPAAAAPGLVRKPSPAAAGPDTIKKASGKDMPKPRASKRSPATTSKPASKPRPAAKSTKLQPPSIPPDRGEGG